jgi:hypothetical protein
MTVKIVTLGLVPRVHVLPSSVLRKTWTIGTSPVVTIFRIELRDAPAGEIPS